MSNNPRTSLRQQEPGTTDWGNGVRKELPNAFAGNWLLVKRGPIRLNLHLPTWSAAVCVR